VLELRQQYPLDRLLKVVGLPRSTFFYQKAAMVAVDKYAAVKETIKALYIANDGIYGYRVMTLALRNLGELLNHKTVRRLMGELGMNSQVKLKKYKSYKGEVGRTAPNRLNRKFKAKRARHKLVTDVTEFKVGGKKLYLSPVMDLHNGEILAWEMATRPVYEMVDKMLMKVLKLLAPGDKAMLHSDQGWQYQMEAYRQKLKDHEIKQSMSRKGNCHDNAPMESFFGLLKSEFFHRKKFSSLEELQAGLSKYIHYYNHDRIKAKLGGLSPVQFRLQAAASK
jgi:transposase InsO family protein